MHFQAYMYVPILGHSNLIVCHKVLQSLIRVSRPVVNMEEKKHDRKNEIMAIQPGALRQTIELQWPNIGTMVHTRYVCVGSAF